MKYKIKITGKTPAAGSTKDVKIEVPLKYLSNFWRNKKNFKTHDNIRKIATGQGHDNTTGCLLDYNYFMEHYKIIEIDLSKQQKLGADPKAVQQIKFTKNMETVKSIFFIIEEAKETVLDFSKGTVKVL